MAAKKEIENEDMLEMNNNDVLSAVDKKIAEMLATAEQKANDIIAAAEKRADELKSEPKKAESDTAKANAELEEYVEVKLFKDNGKYKDDVFVSVNGENCLIKRGVKTKIKRKFALVLEQSDLQDYMTAQLMDAKEKEFQQASKEFFGI